MTPAEYVSERQGQPYTLENHCWALVRETQRDLFGRALPEIVLDDHPTPLALVRAFHRHPERQRWSQATMPVHGAIVLMHRPGSGARAVHAGTYLNIETGGVFHTDEDHGVTFDTTFELNLRNWRCEFYIPGAPCIS